MALAVLRVSERVEKRYFGAIYARSGAGMSLSAALIRADPALVPMIESLAARGQLHVRC